MRTSDPILVLALVCRPSNSSVRISDANNPISVTKNGDPIISRIEHLRATDVRVVILRKNNPSAHGDAFVLSMVR
jgi:hypothetical protein